MSANDQYDDVPAGDAVDNDYASRTGQSEIPVQKDEAPIDEPYNTASADSDEQLAQDESDAIDRSNIIESRTRGATKQAGTYAEPGDEEGLPGPEDGTSAGRQ